MNRVSDEQHDPLQGLRSGYLAATAIVACLAVLIGWAALTHVDSAVHADGTVVPVGFNRKAQHLEGGVVRELLVHEGDEVAAGQVLVRIAPEQAASALGERQARIDGFIAAAARLQAEARGDAAFTVPEGANASFNSEAQAFLADRAAIAHRATAYEEEARRDDLDASSKRAQLAGLKEQSAALGRSLQMQREAARGGGGSPARLAEAEAQTAALHAQESALPDAILADEAAARSSRSRAQAEMAGGRAEAAVKLAQTRSDLASLQQDAGGAQDRLDRVDVRSPVRGIIQKLNVNDVGEVVPPNATVAEIVPTADGLVVEVRVRPEDMRGLKPGLRALVRMSAYDVSRYGSLDGTVVSLSPDAAKDERTGQAFYRVRVRTDQDRIGGEAVRVGMQASVAIITGRRTILHYLTNPIVDWSQMALSDR